MTQHAEHTERREDHLGHLIVGKSMRNRVRTIVLTSLLASLMFANPTHAEEATKATQEQAEGFMIISSSVYFGCLMIEGKAAREIVSNLPSKRGQKWQDYMDEVQAIASKKCEASGLDAMNMAKNYFASLGLIPDQEKGAFYGYWSAAGLFPMFAMRSLD